METAVTTTKNMGMIHSSRSLAEAYCECGGFEDAQLATYLVRGKTRLWRRAVRE